MSKKIGLGVSFFKGILNAETTLTLFRKKSSRIILMTRLFYVEMQLPRVFIVEVVV